VYEVLFPSGHRRSVNVDRLLQYHPFDGPDAVDDMTTGQAPDPLSRPKPTRASPGNPLPCIKDVDGLKNGDLCLLKFDDSNEPMVISRFLNKTGGPPNGTGMLFQWMGGYTCPDPILRLKTQKWMNGWLAPPNRFYYWKTKRTHPSHEVYTNARTDHIVAREAVLMTHFGLQADGKFPRPLIPTVEALWTSHDFHIPGTSLESGGTPLDSNYSM
jgi:hypothetical protein